MKNFFIGFTHYDTSVCVVNSVLLQYLPKGKYKANYSGGGLKRRLNSYWNILTSKRIVISGIFLSRSEVRLMKLLRKKIIYLMHGSYTMETGKQSPTEQYVRRVADCIVSVSRVHAAMIAKESPEQASKIAVWFNGVDWRTIGGIKKETGRFERDLNKIVLFGGGRNMKGNLEVCRAVERLNNEQGMNLTVDVYGEMRDDDFSNQIAEIPCVNYKPLMPRDKINYELAKAGLFIANSHFDTFNLALMDAIGVGCNVLFSKNVGAKDVIPARTDDDIIFDVTNIDEIMQKINNVLLYPNNARLDASIDRDATSWEKRAIELHEIVSKI